MVIRVTLTSSTEPPLKPDGFEGWSEFQPAAGTRRRRHNARSAAGTANLQRGRKRTMELFSHPSCLAAFIRPLFNDPRTDMKMYSN